jgi:superfamily II DNA or RNA helicase
MGVLVLMCGVGKTLISLWTCQRMGMRRILIGVPNLMLLEQWSKEVHRVYSNLRESQICKVCDMMEIEDIQEFLQENVEECIVITTYQSAFKVYQATETMNFYFDIKFNFILKLFH